MAKVNHNTKELAIAAAVTDGGVEYDDITVYERPVQGPLPSTKEAVYMIIQVRAEKWQVLKSDASGVWTETA